MMPYINIQALREKNVLSDGELLELKNDSAFLVGDYIVIEELLDGYPISICKNNDKIEWQSNCKFIDIDYLLLNHGDFLNKFFSLYPNYIIYGVLHDAKNNEYETKPSIIHVFDAYDIENKCWLHYATFRCIASILKVYTNSFMLPIHTMYQGNFISWEHCKSFLNDSHYGEYQKGIIIKNMSAYGRNTNEEKEPWVLKLT